jgi:hypothetical protein
MLRLVQQAIRHAHSRKVAGEAPRLVHWHARLERDKVAQEVNLARELDVCDAALDGGIDEVDLCDDAHHAEALLHEAPVQVLEHLRGVGASVA